MYINKIIYLIKEFEFTTVFFHSHNWYLILLIKRKGNKNPSLSKRALWVIQLSSTQNTLSIFRGRGSAETAFDSSASKLMRKFIENCMEHALRVAPMGCAVSGGCIFRKASCQLRQSTLDHRAERTFLCLPTALVSYSRFVLP